MTTAFDSTHAAAGGTSAIRDAARTPQLDGLRAFAIVLVIIAHAYRTVDPAQDLARQAVGEVGVSVFFVLSGFLITTLLVRERARSGRIDLRAFYGRRLRRIFPAYYAYLAVLAALTVAGFIKIAPQELLLDALYLRDYYAHSFSWLEHTWSLAVETQFYLFWPALLLWFGKSRARIAAIACIALEPLVRIGSYAAFPSARDLLSIAFHTRVDMLMFGCALALLMENGAPAWLRSATQKVPPWLSFVVLGLCVAATAKFHGAFQFAIGMTLEGAAISLMLANVLERPQTTFARLLRSAPATWTGRISYSLYLWQQPFLFPIGDSIFGRFPLNLAGLFLTACLSYYVVERTFFRAKPVEVVA
jgi:peptidoglycan/LPS O-acetylase OafA/YrhL